MFGCDHLTFRFPKADRPLFADLTLHISPSERVALMGANGSGKSTLALLLAGLLRPADGAVHLPSVTSDTLPVGILFQNPDEQLIAATVERDIALGLENLGIAPAAMKTRVSEIMERFRITHLRERLVSELSGGEKVRVALAGLLVLKPRLLILDEPDSYLDESGKQILLSELQALHTVDPKIAILHITQYQQIAQQYPRLVTLDSGRVTYDSAPKVDQSSAHTNQKKIAQIRSDKSAILKVSSLAHRYEDVSTFANLSFTLNSGSTMAIVGASGSGKSTLALVLSGILKPTSGAVHIETTDNTKLVTMLFQFPEKQFFLPTCREELQFGPKNYGKTPTDAETDCWLAEVGLDAATYRERDPLSLSGGEKRRLAFALPFGLPAQFIIFDEPTAGLDEAGVMLFYELVASLKQKGKGVIIITHDGNTVKSLADSVLLMSPKQQAQFLSAEQFFAGGYQDGLLSTF